MVLPVKKFSVGSIHVAVWEKPGKDGSTFYSISMERRYTDENGQWKSTNSLKVNDLPKAVLALQKAYEFALLREPKIVEKEEKSEQ